MIKSFAGVQGAVFQKSPLVAEGKKQEKKKRFQARMLLLEEGINTIAGAFRNIHISRSDEIEKTTEEKTYLLHGVALIGLSF